MKRLFLISATFFTICNGCKKEDVNQHTTVPPPPPPLILVKKNTAPFAHAGWWDIGVLLSEKAATLSGEAYDLENNIIGYLWKKVSGPASYTIENPNAKETRVKDLQKGTYEFEFIVTDSAGLTAKDAVTVTVFDTPLPGPAEVILKDQQWLCPMSCSLLISCLRCYVPAGTTFTVYVKKPNSANWIQAVPDYLYVTHSATNKYFYTLTANGDLELYTDDEPYSDIMIKY